MKVVDEALTLVHVEDTRNLYNIPVVLGYQLVAHDPVCERIPLVQIPPVNRYAILRVDTCLRKYFSALVTTDVRVFNKSMTRLLDVKIRLVKSPLRGSYVSCRIRTLGNDVDVVDR